MTKYWKEFIIGIISILIYFLLSYFIIELFNYFSINFNDLNATIKVLYLCLIDFLTVSILLLLHHKTIEDNFNDMRKNHKKYFSSCMKYWLIGLVVMITCNLILYLFSNDIAANENSIREMLKSNPIYIYFSAVICAPIVEELVFRQSLSNIIKNKYLFIILSGLIFGSLHVVSNDINSVIDILYIIPYSALGISFAIMLTKTKNIFTSIGFHLMHNGILVSFQLLLLLFT